MSIKEWLVAHVGEYEPQIITIGDQSLVGPDWAYVSGVALLIVLILCFFRLAGWLIKGAIR